MTGAAVDEDISLYVYVTASSFAFFFLLFFFVSSRISTRFLRSYRDFPKAKKIDWDTRIGSNVHAVVVSVIALCCALFDQQSHDNPVWGKGVLVRCGVAITYGYLIADFIIISVYYNLIGDVFTMTHHIMAIASYYVPVIQGVVLFFANYRQLAEISTVFVNQRWYYSASKTPHSSRGFLINACCMLTTFFLVRIATMPHYYYTCFRYSWGYTGPDHIGTLYSVLLFTNSGVVDVINIYWMYKMIRGGLRLLRNNNDRTKAS